MRLPNNIWRTILFGWWLCTSLLSHPVCRGWLYVFVPVLKLSPALPLTQPCSRATGPGHRHFVHVITFAHFFFYFFHFWQDWRISPTECLIRFWSISTFNFQDQTWNLLYLSQKWSDCHETKGKHIDWTLGLNWDHRLWPGPLPWPWIFKVNMEFALPRPRMVRLPRNEKQTYRFNFRPQIGPSVLTLGWPWLWPWPWIFKIEYGIRSISANKGPIATKRKTNISIELQASNRTIRFDLGHERDLEFSINQPNLRNKWPNCPKTQFSHTDLIVSTVWFIQAWLNTCGRSW